MPQGNVSWPTPFLSSISDVKDAFGILTNKFELQVDDVFKQQPSHVYMYMVDCRMIH